MSLPAETFARAAVAKAGDLRHRAVLQKTLTGSEATVNRVKTRFANWQEARSHAAQIKWDTVNHLDRYLEEFERNVLANGGHVHWAEDAEQARQIVLAIARQHNVRKVVKSKSMVTEEIELNATLEATGIRGVETDLGEYICQLRHEPPYHIVAPVIHLAKADIAQTFHELFGTSLTATAEELTAVARERLRQEFLTADMGITGANFAIAETGMIALTENEGNIRLSFSLPRIHVAILGIEKLVPRFGDLALLWPLLATSASGQPVSCYNSMIAGPRRADEPDGPEEFHVVLLDNGRTRLLADVEQRDALHCIRCGACLNACPVYRTIGGHVYGTTYQGPIGAVITPHLRGDDWMHLPYASSLCGACTDVCPVRIDLHHHLLHNRRNAVTRKLDSPWQRLAFQVWSWAMQSEVRYRLAARALPFLRRWLPAAPRESFRDWWRNNERRA